MTAIALVIFVIAILYVMVWSIKNEDARSISDQTGFIKMRDSSKTPRHSSGRKPRGPSAR
jgi:uncharacterized membrane protein